MYFYLLFYIIYFLFIYNNISIFCYINYNNKNISLNHYFLKNSYSYLSIIRFKFYNTFLNNVYFIFYFYIKFSFIIFKKFFNNINH